MICEWFDNFLALQRLYYLNPSVIFNAFLITHVMKDFPSLLLKYVWLEKEDFYIFYNILKYMRLLIQEIIVWEYDSFDGFDL